MRRGAKLPEWVVERIVALSWNGWTIGDIAKEVGCSDRTVSRVRVRHGISRGEAHDPIPEHVLAQAARLLDDGASYTDAAATVGCSRTALRRKFPGRGWDRRQCAEWRVIARMERAIA
ncbi:DNA binding protein [Mycobacterium phage Royals2015]|uniref:HTH binding domain protein n=2 Tax=Cheoctovirus TaxID=1623281 RepID=A0A0H4TF54_9CAUD|nr:DNA binding protein [Mycobacterium phage Ovechkin]YP_009961993.1 DNA binding protein [Mycobacterium phage Royals2015]QFR56894.1 helix-turn-helix DNA binding domain protein [Mycobacterium phage Juice456]UEM46030.1 helix-turn-helix DNA binding domain protein [Mycobacterium phage JalFarm20]WNM68444.1 helix-turn-helix DNA binding domain protein [Mycobacterium phage Starcevich]AKQ06960.1 HTH binding domain protein [Mycobacterium phage Ovechkin]QNO12376.1 helix-turn-helix DNA binding domain prot